MWTYLVILFSLSVLVGVFIRRFVLLSRKDRPAKKNMVNPAGQGEEATATAPKKKVSNTDKDLMSSLCKRGFALITAGKDDEAIKCFVQALAIDADHQETQHRLAMLYLQKQMFGAAAALFGKLAEITQDPLHYSHLGLALYKQAEFAPARDAYQKALELDDSRPQRFVSLSQVYRAMGQLNHAVIALNKAIQLEAENVDFLFLLADIQVELGNFDEASEILGRLLEADPKNRDAKALLKAISTMKLQENASP